MKVSVRELKNHLSEYLRQVQAGQALVVTSRGKPVAQLGPAEPEPEDPEAAAIARLRAQPWIRPGRGGKPVGAKHPIPWKPGEKMLSEIVSEERG